MEKKMTEMVQFGQVTICYEPMREHSRRSEGVHWCFKCRKRRDFWWIVITPVEEFSYYGPSAAMKCGVCETTDSDLFPGWTRESLD